MLGRDAVGSGRRFRERGNLMPGMGRRSIGGTASRRDGARDRLGGWFPDVCWGWLEMGGLGSVIRIIGALVY